MSINECPICYEPIIDDELLTVCGHLFHEQCIVTWWQKLKRNQCPYCTRCDSIDQELITNLENLICKLVNYRGVRDMSIENLRKVTININDRWCFRRAINFILSNDDASQETINHCLESLVSRNYLRKVNNSYYYVH